MQNGDIELVHVFNMGIGLPRIRFEINTFEVAHRENFAKIREFSREFRLVPWFKMFNFGHLGSKFSKTNVRFEISTFEIDYR